MCVEMCVSRTLTKLAQWVLDRSSVPRRFYGMDPTQNSKIDSGWLFQRVCLTIQGDPQS